MCMFFFFQAEDGIRDYKVTGVQTCALPIWGRTLAAWPGAADPLGEGVEFPLAGSPCALTLERDVVRSEERRVGKSVDLGGRRIIKKKKKRKKKKKVP